MSWIEPVIDHVDGESYEYEDMNRVGSDVQYLADLLNGYGYAVTVSSKIDWVQGQIPTPEQMEQYLSDLDALKAAFYGTTVLPVSMDDLAEGAANDIEKLLLELETYINRMLLSFWYSGEAYCGEA